MSGTVEGSLKAAKTNKEKYGKDFYRMIGAKGGKRGKTGGFASDVVGKDGLTGKERALRAGSVGGKISKRKPTAYIDFRGEKRSVQYVSEMLGISRGAVYSRLKNKGSVE